MILELNTDISQELNITARRNDSFEMRLGITDPNNSSISYDLSGSQSGFVINSTESGINYTGLGSMTIFQAKMTIKKPNTESESLNIYTWWWKDKRTVNVKGSSIKTGHWSGEDFNGLGNQSFNDAGIWLKSSTGALGDQIYVSIPGDYMNIDPGNYVYDFQLRKRSNWLGSNSEVSTKYTTLIRGMFTMIDDITK